MWVICIMYPLLQVGRGTETDKALKLHALDMLLSNPAKPSFCDFTRDRL